jgi:hypothetical protein
MRRRFIIDGESSVGGTAIGLRPDSGWIGMAQSEIPQKTKNNTVLGIRRIMGAIGSYLTAAISGPQKRQEIGVSEVLNERSTRSR